MTVVWVEHSHSADKEAHTAIYSISAGTSFVVCCLYLVSGIHKRCSGSIIVKRVFCDLAYFTVMAISSDLGLGKQVLLPPHAFFPTDALLPGIGEWQPDNDL